MPPVIGEQERKLILDLLLRRITDNEFLRKYPVASDCAPGLATLIQAARFADPVGVEFGLYLGHRFGLSEDYLHVLCELATASWHDRHEGVIDGLAELCSPASVDTLYAAAISQYSYCEADDAAALRAKVTWVLRRIETPEAIEKLGALLRGDHRICSAEARLRLEDITRRGATSLTRELAKGLIASHDLR